MFPFLCTRARALTAGIGGNRLQEGRGRGEGSYETRERKCEMRRGKW